MTNHRRFLWYPTAPELHKETTFSIFLIFFFFRECFICGAGPIPIKAYFVVLSRDCGILKAPPRSATNSNYTRNIMILNFSASSSGFAFCWVLRSFSRAELCPIGISFRNVHCSRQIFLLFYIMCLKGHWFISVSCCLLPLFVTLFLHWWYLSRSKKTRWKHRLRQNCSWPNALRHKFWLYRRLAVLYDAFPISSKGFINEVASTFGVHYHLSISHSETDNGICQLVKLDNVKKLINIMKMFLLHSFFSSLILLFNRSFQATTIEVRNKTETEKRNNEWFFSLWCGKIQKSHLSFYFSSILRDLDILCE